MEIRTQPQKTPFWTDTRSWGAGLIISGSVLMAASASVAFPTTAVACTAVGLAVIFGALARQLRRQNTEDQSLLFHTYAIICGVSGATVVGLLGSFFWYEATFQILGPALTIIGLYALIFNQKTI